MNNRGSITASPRPASPSTSVPTGLTKTTSHPRTTSPQPTRLGPDHRNQSGILHNPSSVTPPPNSNKRNSVSQIPQIPSSPRASRTTLKTSSGDLAEKQAQKHTQNGTTKPEEDRMPPLTDVMIYDYSGELVYVAAYASLRGTLDPFSSPVNIRARSDGRIPVLAMAL